MITKKYLSLTLPILLCASSCTQMINKRTTDAVVQIENNVLYLSDIENVTKGLSSNDSMSVAQEYVKDWIVNILEYKQATKKNNATIENMVENYRRMLYIHLYEQELLANKNETPYPDSILEQYYHKHEQDFILSDNLVKGSFLIIHADAPNKQQAYKYMKSADKDNLDALEQYAYQYGTNFDVFFDEWRSLSQFRVMMPINSKELIQKIRYLPIIECSDSLFTYLLCVTDKCLEGEIMPKELALEEIKQKLIKQDQVNYINTFRENMYKNAIAKKKVIFYER